MNTLIVNMFGGPGIGKSALASGVYHLLKTRGVECELIPEFAKDCVWDDHTSVFENQLFIFATQHHRIFRCLGKVEALIVDSPLLLPVIYGEHLTNSHFLPLVAEEFLAMNNMNFLLERGDFEYQEVGRNQTKEEAIVIDNKVIASLEEYNVPHESVIVSGRDDAHIIMAGQIQDKLNELNRSKN